MLATMGPEFRKQLADAIRAAITQFGNQTRLEIPFCHDGCPKHARKELI
jgi:hypothetical protein